MDRTGPSFESNLNTRKRNARRQFQKDSSFIFVAPFILKSFSYYYFQFSWFLIFQIFMTRLCILYTYTTCFFFFNYETIMGVISMRNPPILPTSPFPNPSSNDSDSSSSSSSNRVIAFTTPQNYAGRLSHLLQLKGWTPLWCPTVIVEPTPQTKSCIQFHLSIRKPSLEEFSAIAFTSRTGILAFSQVLNEIKTHPLSPHGETTLTISALGKDSELIDKSFKQKICKNPDRIRVLVPPIATPSGMVDSLGLGQSKRVLCPVPLVIDLEEPPVVPKFLRDLSSNGWVAVRVSAYETRWAGTNCAAEIVRRGEKSEEMDAIVFTSTAEVEGLLKSLAMLRWDWDMVRKTWPQLIVAAHGPVTASGAERLGVGIDMVGSRFDSFDGIVDALALRWKSLEETVL